MKLTKRGCDKKDSIGKDMGSIILRELRVDGGMSLALLNRGA
jgi:hypothetical protein